MSGFCIKSNKHSSSLASNWEPYLTVASLYTRLSSTSRCDGGLISESTAGDSETALC